MPRSFSRFLHTDKIIYNGHETYGYWRPPNFLVEKPPARVISRFAVTSSLAGRPDLIANAIYGTPMLDWVLIAFNAAYGDVREPLNWPEAGDVILYPADSWVMPEL